jgi:ribonuclease HII
MKKEERDALLRQKLIEMKRYEFALYNQGATFVAGVDEVGRGPLAGPVVAASVILPQDFGIIGVDDSKKLSEKKRNEMAVLIRESAIAYGIGMCNERVIDEINILEATKLAMKEAIHEAEKMLGSHIDHILLDAVTLRDLDRPQTAIIHGDCLSVSIAAASILAKVTRDAMMAEYSLMYPHYCFEQNKGYGTKSHYQGIEEHGFCQIHRRSFLKKYL